MAARDERGYRVALTADGLVNPEPGGVDGLAVLEELGWGAMQLPAPWLCAELAAGLLDEIAEQAREFSSHRYDLVVLLDDDAPDGGGHREALRVALARAHVPYPDELVVTGADELRAFLAARPDPEAR